MTIIRSNRGSVILTAMIAALSIGVVTAIIMQQAQVTERQTRAPRIKSAMSSMESQIIEAANSGTLFQACATSNPNFSQPNCREINPTKIAQFQVKIAGAQCATPPCGIRLAPLETAFNGGTNVLTAKIYYDGTETSIAPRTIVSTIANDAWTAKTSTCPAATPLLTGFDVNGDKICKKLPDPCPSTEYITAVDPMSMTTNAGRTCTPLPGLQTCAAGTFIANFQWTGAGNVILNCQGLYDPFNPLALPSAGTYAFFGSGGFGNTAPWPNAPPGVCGPSDGATFAAAPAAGLCSTGNPSAVAGAGPWTWTCSGTPPASCSASPPPSGGPPTLIFSACFVAGTQVTMADGSVKDIEKVKVGEKTLTYDELTGQQTISPVVQVFHHPKKISTLYTMTLSDGTSMTSNDVHPYFLPDYGQYASASEIYQQWVSKVQLRLLNDKNQMVAIIHVDKTTKSVKLYNLHVTSIYDRGPIPSKYGHNYFAGGALVHNLKCLQACNNQAFGDDCCRASGGTVVLTSMTNNATTNCYINPILSPIVNACVASSLAGMPDAECPGFGCDGGCEHGPCSGVPNSYGMTAPPGACGPSNGATLASAPTGNLCSVGSATPVSGAGPWTWLCTGVPNKACSANKAAVPPPAPPTAWNCYDGFAGGPCGAPINIVDDGAISGTNPGSAWTELIWNMSNGTWNQRCQCSAGTRNMVSCDAGINRAYYVCTGGSTTLPNCTFAQAAGGPPARDATPMCAYNPGMLPNGGWSCVNPSVLYPCP